MDTISPIPFYLEEKHRDRCKKCHENEEKFFALPVPNTWIPYQICIPGEFATVDPTVRFFNNQGAEEYTRDYCLDIVVCDGNTYITNKLGVLNENYDITSENWTDSGGVVFGANSAIIDNGSLITSPNLPVCKVNFCVDIVAGTGTYEIRIFDGTITTVLFSGSTLTTHCFEVDVLNGTTQIIIEYLAGEEGALTVENMELCDCTLEPLFDDCFEGYATMLLDGNINIFSEYFKSIPQEELDQCHLRVDYENDCAIGCFEPFEGYFYFEDSNGPLGASGLCNPEYVTVEIGDDDEEGNLVKEQTIINEEFLLIAVKIPQYFVTFLSLLQMFEIVITINDLTYNVTSLLTENSWDQSGCYATTRITITTNTWSRTYCC